MSAGLQVTVSLKELGDAPVEFDIVPTPDELKTLARRFGLRSLDSVRANGLVSELRGGAALRVEGRLQASLSQNCVVTLEPVKQTVDEPFCLEFGDNADVIDAATGELVVAPDQDPPDPMPVGRLDLGEIVSEQLALAIDPYPRKEGADLEAVLRQHGVAADAGKPNPFAALAALKSKG